MGRNKMKLNDLVIYLGEDAFGNRRNNNDDSYAIPDVGVIGRVIEEGAYHIRVQWPRGTTSGTDKWWVERKFVAKLY